MVGVGRVMAEKDDGDLKDWGDWTFGSRLDVRLLRPEWGIKGEKFCLLQGYFL